MEYLLLTGATGLLGQYLLRDAWRAGMRMAVLARGEKAHSARRRIEAVAHDIEDPDGPACSRPVVLEGDLELPNCGLGPSAIAWIARNCRAVVHSAASLSFQQSGGEPRKTNVEGTGQLLRLCEATGIRTWHHVSTAFISGQRTGRVLEAEFDVGQRFSNAYEQSKFESERLVRGSPHLDRVTVFRPSIIVGDFKTGRTSSFHGFYTPLQLALALTANAKKIKRDGAESYLGRLGLRGDERKNFVPVDWVSAVMLHIVRHPKYHGQTYHLASDRPIAVQEIDQAISAAIATAKPRTRRATLPRIDHDFQFVEQMGVYRDYLRDDAEFDTTHTRLAAPHLPCPAVDRAALVKLAKYAMDANFGWPRRRHTPPQFDVEQELGRVGLVASWVCAGSLGLDVSGPGGGQWQVAFEADRPVDCGFGYSSKCAAVAHLHAHTWEAIAKQQITIERAIADGRLVVEVRHGGGSQAETWLAALMELWRRAPGRPLSVCRAPLLQENSR